MSYEQPTCEELAKDALVGMMRDISEDCWCAGWLNGLEFTLWDAVTTGEMEVGWGTVETRELVRMKFLHELVGGWWTWPEGESGERFVTTEEWLAILLKRVPDSKP